MDHTKMERRAISTEERFLRASLLDLDLLWSTIITHTQENHHHPNMNGSKSPTTTTATTSSNNRSHIDPPLQIAAEQDLAQEFLSILQGHHRDIQRSSPPPSVAAGHGVADDDSLAGISVAERKILSRVSYQNWTAGCCAGALTFGLLVGLSRRAAARRYRLPQRAAAALRDLDVTTTTTKRRAVAGPRPQRGSSNSTMGQPSSQNETAMDPTSLRSDVMSEGTRTLSSFSVIYTRQ